MAHLMHAMYRRGIEEPYIISGLRFVKVSNTEHHYMFAKPGYNNMYIDKFIPYIYINDIRVDNPCDIKIKATIEDDKKENYVKVLIEHPTDVGYILKVEVDDETFVKLL